MTPRRCSRSRWPCARGSAGKASTRISCRANSARGCSWGRFSPTSICRPTRRKRTIADNAAPASTRARPSAFPAPYRLDARRCISYLTIEHEGPIPRELRPAIGNRIYGCDDCLAVCPWNKFASVGREAKLAARADLEAPPLAELARLDDASFRSLFAGGPIKRVGRARFVRNVMIAIGNSKDRSLAKVAEERLDDESPLVRGAAVWALARLISRAELSSFASERLRRESDATIIEEWRDALSAPL